MKKMLRLVKPGCGDECPEGRGSWGKDRGIWGMGQVRLMEIILLASVGFREVSGGNPESEEV
jgi:hypothetical protein